jgi:O-methyltransferase
MTPDAFKGLLNAAPQGPRIEIGVHAGQSLALIADHDDQTIGVDSFEGMAEPGPEDFHAPGRTNYPKGRLAVGIDRVRRFVGQGPVLIKGFVPDVLTEIPDGPYAFAHLDIDHYEPTRQALAWLFEHMAPGGALCCDDWFPGQDCLAAKALNEAAAMFPISGSEGRKVWWIC